MDGTEGTQTCAANFPQIKQLSCNAAFGTLIIRTREQKTPTWSTDKPHLGGWRLLLGQAFDFISVLTSFPRVSRQFSIVVAPLIGLNPFKVQMDRVSAQTGHLSLLKVCDIIQSAVRSPPPVTASTSAQMAEIGGEV